MKNQNNSLHGLQMNKPNFSYSGSRFKQMNPYSSYHLSFNIGYPNRYDRGKGYTGSVIMVHGDCVSIGCFAIRDNNIEEIWALLVNAFEAGQQYIQLHSFPFRMKESNMERHSNSQWFPFWSNLQEGYLIFEENGVPPRVKVVGGRYCF